MVYATLVLRSNGSRIQQKLELPALSRGGTRKFTTGADASDRGLIYSFMGTINAKNLQKNGFYLLTEGLYP